MFSTKPTQKNKKFVRNLEGLEQLRELSGGLGQAARQEGKNMFNDALKQLGNLERDVQKLSGELKAGEAIDLTQVDTVEQTYEPSYPEFKGYQQPGIDYHREFSAIREVRVVKEDTQQIQVRIEQILGELRKLTSSSQELAVQFEEVTMETVPVEAGTYHLNFFEWVFSVIRKARERIEESQTWLAMFKSKKAQRSYWNMFQKHGTTFGLSGERVVATQTG